VTTGVVVDRGLWVIRPDGSSLHQLSKPPDDQICEGCNPIHWRARSPDWSSDGRSIAYIPIQSNWIAVYDTVTTQVNVIYKSSSSLNNPHFSPDGKTILFYTSVVAGGMMRIGLIDIDGQNLRWLPVSGKEPSWSPNGNQIIYRRYDISAFTYDGWRVLNPGKGWGDLWVFDLKPAKHSQLTFTNGTWGGS
jgi:Tol biopolymer transport system component